MEKSMYQISSLTLFSSFTIEHISHTHPSLPPILYQEEGKQLKPEQAELVVQWAQGRCVSRSHVLLSSFFSPLCSSTVSLNKGESWGQAHHLLSFWLSDSALVSKEYVSRSKPRSAKIALFTFPHLHVQVHSV